MGDAVHSAGAAWSSFEGQLRGFVSRRVPATDVDDVLQDVYVRVHRALHTVRDAERLEAWLYRIARNVITDRYRARRPESPVDELPDVAGSAGPGTDEPEAEERLKAGLRAMVEDLPEPYREALLLVEYEGLTQQELAERAGLSLPGAKSRVQRARKMLRDALLTCCHFEFDRRGTVIDYWEHCCCCAGHEE